MTDPMQNKDTAQPNLHNLPFTPSAANTIHMLAGKIHELAPVPGEQKSNRVFLAVLIAYDLDDPDYMQIIPRTPCEHDSEIVAALQNPRKRVRTRKKGGMSGC